MTVTLSSHATLEDRIHRLEAIEEIKQLKARYLKCCDDGYDPRSFASFFTEDGVWAGPEESYAGRDAISSFIERVRPELRWNFHYAVSPIITFAPNGRSADVIWSATVTQSIQSQNPEAEEQDVVNLMRYFNTVKLVDGEWLFSRVEPRTSRSWDLTQGEWRN